MQEAVNPIYCRVDVSTNLDVYTTTVDVSTNPNTDFSSFSSDSNLDFEEHLFSFIF